MAKSQPLFLYIGTYTSESAARADYNALTDHLSAIAFHTYDAAVVSKDTAGRVHVNHDNFMTRHGVWGGAAVGAMVGILFPPAMIATAAIGARPELSAATPGEDSHGPMCITSVSSSTRAGRAVSPGRDQARISDRQPATEGRTACLQTT